jgi:NIMA (never in mitosis gene a)-related kinase
MADQYRAMQVIGKGSYGVVRLLQRKTDKKLYVMKMVECKQESQDDALKEVNLLAKLNHPNIVGFVENFFSSKGELCIVMEYCDSGDLDGYITELKKSKRQMSEDACLDYFVQISMALQYLHEHHILHRDLKPANVFLSNQRRMVKLGDFGITKTLENSVAMAITRIGTPYYFSPELCRSKPYNDKSDVWALGVVTYQMMKLRLPFEARDMNELVHMVLNTKPSPPPSYFQKDFKQLVAGMLAKSPHHRPSVKQILAQPLLQAKLQELMALYGQQDDGMQQGASRHELNNQPIDSSQVEVTTTKTKNAAGGHHVTTTVASVAAAPAPAPAPASAAAEKDPDEEMKELEAKQEELKQQLARKRGIFKQRMAAAKGSEADMNNMMKGGDLAAQLAAARAQKEGGGEGDSAGEEEVSEADIRALEKQLIQTVQTMHSVVEKKNAPAVIKAMVDSCAQTLTIAQAMQAGEMYKEPTPDDKDEDGVDATANGYGDAEAVIVSDK